MERRRYVNPSQPQTMQIAVFLLYISAAFLVLDMLIAAIFPWLYVLSVAGQVAAGYGIANERRWGYALGIAMAFFPFAIRFYYLGNPLAGAGVIQLMFEVALVALLLHPQSRDYQRIWFK